MALTYSLNAGGTSYSVVYDSCTAGAVTIPSTNNGLPVTAIGNSAFFFCSSITSVTIPNSVTSIGNSAFYSCSQLASVTIPYGVTSIGFSAFYGCGSLTSVTIPDSVTTIEGLLFVSCTSLTNITIPNSVTNIGANMFFGCTSLTSITIPKSINSIGDSAFINCTNLNKINFLGNAPTLGLSVFDNTNANLKIYRKKNLVTGWSSTFGGEPVVLISDNVIKRGGSGKMTGKQRYDLDAISYFNRVQAADGQDLEETTRTAINTFIVGCKSDGIWDAIKSSCILAGARTLNGALVSLKGTSPTNMGFVSGDYDRKTGLLGDGSSKYLISNRNITSDPLNNKHLSVYATTGNTRDAVRVLIGSASGASIGASLVFTNTTNFNGRISYGSPPAGIPQAGLINGLQGATRSNVSTVNYYFNNTSGSYENTSFGQSASDINIFANASAAVGNFSNARIAFYSIGENIDLSKLDNRLVTLMSALSTLT